MQHEEPNNLNALSATPVVDKLTSCSYTSMQLPLSSANHECTSTTALVESVHQEIPTIIHRSSTDVYSTHCMCGDSIEAENAKLKNTFQKPSCLTVEDLKDDENLFSFHTGFKSYNIFLAFFEFLGPAVYKLNYWGSKTTQVRKTSANGPVTYDPYESKT